MRLLMTSRSLTNRRVPTLSIPYVPPAPAPQLLLDSVTASPVLAFSLRQLKSSYTGNCIRLRRSIDNVEQDFSFQNNVLDLAGVNNFLGANNGFITAWYDQSGNSNNTINPTSSLQPQLIINGWNNKPTIKFNEKYLYNLNLPIIPNSGFTGYITYRLNGYVPTSTTNNLYRWRNSNITNFIITSVNTDNTSNQLFAIRSNNVTISSGYTVQPPINTNYIHENIITSDKTVIGNMNGINRFNVSFTESFSTPMPFFSIGANINDNGSISASALYCNADISEIIIFNQQLSNSLNSQINSYYGVY